MEYLKRLGLLALGSRTKALSDRLYGLADSVYRSRGLALQGRWFPLLRLLQERGPQTVGQAAEAIGQTHSAVSQLATRLVREGWLQAIAADGDRRQRVLGLTPQAEAALREARPVWRAIEHALARRSAAAGIDLLAAFDAVEAMLDEGIEADILAHARACDRDELAIVPFRPELREAFYRLNEAWLRKYFFLEEIDHRVLSQPEEEILAGGGAILFAMLRGEVVGTCALRHEGEGVYELTKMAVDETWQGLGIGRRLMEAAIAEYMQRRGTRLFLETNARLTPAIRLYESVGFEHQPTRKPDSHYTRSDVYMIWRPADARGMSADSAHATAPV